MRYIVATLIALNLLFLYFGLDGKPPQEMDGRLPREEVNTASIKLLSEGGIDRQRQMEEVVKNPTLLTEGEEANCTAVGPFLSVTVGQSVLEQLVSMEFEVQLRALDSVLDEYYYRVLIPPAPSLDAAFRKLQELQSLGIDSYVITQGEDAFGVSMGVFSSGNAAEVAKLDLQNDGYNTLIREVPRLEREYWIFPIVDQDLDVGEQVLDSIKADFPDVRYGQQICLSEA